MKNEVIMNKRNKKQEVREKTHQKILSAAGRGFRKKGYTGLGVDGLAQKAGLTSGAFYGHFASKKEAFKQAVLEGLRAYSEAVKTFQQEHGEHWASHFLDYYLGEKHRADLECGCAVPGLSSEVMRGDQELKAAYEKELITIAEALSSDSDTDNKRKALVLISLLAGAIVVSRSVQTQELAGELLAEARAWAEKIFEDMK